MSKIDTDVLDHPAFIVVFLAFMTFIIVLGGETLYWLWNHVFGV